MEFFEYDYLIVGAGMVGLSIAHQLKINEPNKKICIIEKETEVGLHSSGRNSGVIHAGIYYKPETLKSRLCIEGAKRLKKWCKQQNIAVLECGKVITPQDINLDFQLDNLFSMGKKNGAVVEIINKNKFGFVFGIRFFNMFFRSIRYIDILTTNRPLTIYHVCRCCGSTRCFITCSSITI